MASAELSRRIEKVVGYPPLSEMGDLQRREFHEALLEANGFEDLPGRWQAAILRASRTGRTCASSAATIDARSWRRRGGRSGRRRSDHDPARLTLDL
jgi:hypothetical protein